MPYNTRRKSLSLPSLGIQLPQTNASRAAAAALAAANRSPPTAASPPPSTTTTSTLTEQPPSKRAKRSHSNPTPPIPIRSRKSTTAAHRRKHSQPSFAHHTPPPSPGASSSHTDTLPSVESVVDVQGINDDIVVGVIQQLEKTANRPHLIKELVVALTDTLPSVDKSANPSAIITSRLHTYLRRPWTALSPCPLAKEVVASHPRRTYFYLTTTPHQPLPSVKLNPAVASRSIISPSVSDEDSSSRSESSLKRGRMELSPSPEIDLSSPDLLDSSPSHPSHPPTPAGSSFSPHTNPAQEQAHAARLLAANPRRTISPPLEGDEKEFSQTASSMQARSALRSLAASQANSPLSASTSTTLDDNEVVDYSVATQEESGGARALLIAAAQPADENETEATAKQRNRETAAALFNDLQPLVVAGSSPALRPTLPAQLLSPSFATRKQFEDMVIDTKLQKNSGESMTSILGDEFGGGWGGDIVSPENVDLDELDDMLGGY